MWRVSGGECTYILDQREALVFAVIELLLLSQVLALGRLETHGDHLCAGQHLASISALCCEQKQDPVPVFVCFCFLILSLSGCEEDDGLGPAISPVTPPACPPDDGSVTPRLLTSGPSAPSAGQNARCAGG